MSFGTFSKKQLSGSFFGFCVFERCACLPGCSRSFRRTIFSWWYFLVPRAPWYVWLLSGAKGSMVCMIAIWCQGLHGMYDFVCVRKVCIPAGLLKIFLENNLQLMVLSGAKGFMVCMIAIRVSYLSCLELLYYQQCTESYFTYRYLI